jgi:HD-GYP domain-containing protein (c-di-GMP phosphodiesterase class II)
VEVQLNLHQYRTTVRSLLANIVECPDHTVMTHQLASCGSLMAGHLANCSYLSLLVGAHMTGYLQNERSTLPPDVAENTSALGLGALLHDIGKLQMDDELQRKCILDPEADWPEYQYHTRVGFEEAREHVSAVAANTILNHHQRYDGRGFPRRKSRQPDAPAAPLAGRQIHVFSRILAVVDTFDHLLRNNGKRVPTIIATHALKGSQFDGWFDPVVVETLLRLVPPFQVGSLVTLSDSSQAAVVKNHPEAPCRPLIKMLKGSLANGTARLAGRQIDLRMCRKPFIAFVDGVNVRPYLFTGDLEPAAP